MNKKEVAEKAIKEEWIDKKYLDPLTSKEKLWVMKQYAKHYSWPLRIFTRRKIGEPKFHDPEWTDAIAHGMLVDEQRRKYRGNDWD